MSQNAIILNYLKLNDGLSPWGAMEKFKCMDLASRIRDLRKMGWHIDTTWKKSQRPNENGKHTRYAYYKLDISKSEGALDLNGRG